jgi:F0F1-type ATP synthase membrane subunit b/b'
MLVLLPAGALQANMLATIMAAIAGTLPGGAMMLHLFYVPSTPALSKRIARLETKIRHMAMRRQRLAEMQADLRNRLQQARARHAALRTCLWLD